MNITRRFLLKLLALLPWSRGSSTLLQAAEEATGDILYIVRVQGDRFQPRVYAAGKYT